MPDLSTRNQRKKLAARSAPYWQRIAPRAGRLDTWRLAGSRNPGRWHVRVRAGGTESGYRFRALGVADDVPHVEADGDEVLAYARALQKAASWDPWDEPRRRAGSPMTRTRDTTRVPLATW